MVSPGPLLAFLAGILSFLSPCVLPLVPSYLSYLSGLEPEQLRQAPTSRVRRQVLWHALAFIAGFSMIFVVLGATTSLLGRLFITHRSLVQKIGGALLVLFGLQLVGVLRLPLLLREYRWRWRATSVSYVGSAAFGIAFAAGWTPCIGPVLSSILVLASGTQGPGAGAWLLGFYALGLAVPFLLAAVALDRLMGVLSRVRRGLRIAEALAGVVLVVAGGLLFTGTMARLNGLLIRLTPEWLLRWL